MTNNRIAELEDRIATLEEAARQAFDAVSTLTGYSVNLSNGCTQSATRGTHFRAHVDGVKEILRAALAGRVEEQS
jgi:pyruvate/2-oxoglutarate dehydrogenase complex dihydrolipoamide acyltransferase (E2) component